MAKKWKGYEVMTIDQIREERSYLKDIMGDEKFYSAGICALVDVINMGFCRDETTRWYIFENANGKKAIYFKY